MDGITRAYSPAYEGDEWRCRLCHVAPHYHDDEEQGHPWTPGGTLRTAEA